MSSIEYKIKQISLEALQSLFPEMTWEMTQVVVSETKPEFEGDFTLVLFPFVKLLRSKPDAIGTQIGDYLQKNHASWVAGYTIVAGFLNITIQNQVLLDFLQTSNSEVNPSLFKQEHRKVMIEYSSPNTNKPLHFGHLRNNFLGWSVAEILKMQGNQVIKANLINDRGIHICKSMIAWQRFGEGATPESTGIKGDHLVGDYYVKYNDVYKEEVKVLVAQGMDEKEAERSAPIFKEAQDLLLQWEQGDEAVYDLWKTMNSWVYKGFDITYAQLGLDFDTVYHESETYLLGKELVQQGLEKGVLYQKENGAIWIDLTAEGLDEKLLLRADGTSVYMTQDLGTAKRKYDDYNGLDLSTYVIADEQNYHMQVLKVILKKLEEPCADGIYHLSYGMVELPSGKMKSREGTVVDADDMIAEMIQIAKEQTEAAGKTEGFSEAALESLYETIGLGALKFYLLRVDPRKKMIFDPKESIDLHGFTAAYIQYAHARICSILRKTGPAAAKPAELSFEPLERKLLLMLEQYPAEVSKAAEEMSPSVICNYTFKLAQTFNSFFDKHSVANAESAEKKNTRIALAGFTAHTIKHAMGLLGITVPEKM